MTFVIDIRLTTRLTFFFLIFTPFSPQFGHPLPSSPLSHDSYDV